MLLPYVYPQYGWLYESFSSASYYHLVLLCVFNFDVLFFFSFLCYRFNLITIEENGSNNEFGSEGFEVINNEIEQQDHNGLNGAGNYHESEPKF